MTTLQIADLNVSADLTELNATGLNHVRGGENAVEILTQLVDSNGQIFGITFFYADPSFGGKLVIQNNQFPVL